MSSTRPAPRGPNPATGEIPTDLDLSVQASIAAAAVQWDAPPLDHPSAPMKAGTR